MKKLFAVALCVVMLSLFLSACNDIRPPDPNVPNPIATITMNDGGTITFVLYYRNAPNTVRNFIALALDGFYDELIFHRVSSNFMIQGGCPAGAGTGGPGYTIVCETEDNPHSHTRGAVSMAHAGTDTGGSQFFIMTDNNIGLDGRHTIFGRVFSGMDVVDRIARQTGQVGGDGTVTPSDPMYIVSIEIETHGHTFREPVTRRRSD